MEDLHSGRLRERPRKEANMRLKRTRHSSRELHVRVEEIEEIDGGEDHAVDEDDMPISPNLRSKPHTKMKFHGKVASNEVVTVEIPAVPRKARTAIFKRPHESSHADGSRRTCTSAAPLSTSTAPSAKLLGAYLKPVKRTKRNSSKIKVVKLSKKSEPVAISLQEVEVAEALFDLARMTSNVGSSRGNNEQMELKILNSEMIEPTCAPPSPESFLLHRQDSVPTPPTSHSVVSSPVQVPIPETSAPLSSMNGPTKWTSLLKFDVEDGAVSELKEHANCSVFDYKSVVDRCRGQSPRPTAPADVKLTIPAKTGQGSHSKGPSSPPTLALPGQSSGVIDTNYVAIQAKGSFSPKEPISNSVSLEDYLMCDASLSVSFSEQKHRKVRHSHQEACNMPAFVKEDTLLPSRPCKYESNLMASSNASARGANDKNDSSLYSGLVSSKQTQDKELLQINHNHFKEVSDESVKEAKALMGQESEASAGMGPAVEHAEGGISKENERPNQLVKVPKQEASDCLQSSKANLTSQDSANRSGWTGSHPPVGYCSAAAAAWSVTGSVVGPLSLAKNAHPDLLVPPSMFRGARHLHKRCATHVYIAHFIDTQLQNPVLADAYGNCAHGSLYALKANYSKAPHFQPNALFGVGLTQLTASNANDRQANAGSEVGFKQNDKDGMLVLKERVTDQNMDVCATKGGSQLSSLDITNQSTPLEGGLKLSSGYSPVSHSTTLLDVGAQNKGVSGVENGELGSCSRLVEVSRGSTSDTEPADTAAAQVQYLQAIIQQAGFPFLSSSGHPMPFVREYVSQQQPTSFSNNYVYNLPVIHSQQNPAQGKVMPKASPHQGHSPSMNYDIHVGQTGSLLQHRQHQQQLRSASSAHSQQRDVAQHLQHVRDVGRNLDGETISSAEIEFPGYENNMYGDEICNNVHASNIASSFSSLSGAGQSIALPARVALAAEQMTGVELPQSVQLQKHLQNTSTYQCPAGGKATYFQAAKTSSGTQMGSLSHNMVGSGPLGFASAASVMSPRGHTALQKMSDSRICPPLTYQESCNKHLYDLNMNGDRAVNVFGMPDDESLLAVKQSSPLKMDKAIESYVAGNSCCDSGLSTTAATGTTLTFMSGAVGNTGLRQPTSAAGNATPYSGDAWANPNAGGAMCEPTSSRSLSPGLVFHLPNVAPNQGSRQGLAVCQYSSQTKPASILHMGTTGVATAPSTLLAGPCSSATVFPPPKQQSYLSENHQTSANLVQSRLLPTTSKSSSTLLLPPASFSKSIVTAPAETNLVGNSSLNSLPKQGLAVLTKKPDVILTHSPGQIMGPSSVAMSMGQALPQQQQMQRIMRQKQQKHRQVLHQEHLEQSNAHQFHVIGLPPGVPLQYHQALGSNQSPYMALNKQSTSPQHAKQCPYLEQHLYRPPKQQSHSTESQRSAQRIVQSQPRSGQQDVALATNHSFQHLSEVQSNRQETASSHHQPVLLGSPGTWPIVAPQNSPVFVGSFSGRPTSLEQNLSQVSGPKVGSCMKSPVATSLYARAPNMRRTDNSIVGISYIQGMGTQMVETKTLRPYFHSSTCSSGMAQGVKVLRASGVNGQSGTVMINMSEGSGGSGHENSTPDQHDNDLSSMQSKVPAISDLSACTKAVKALASPPISARNEPVASCCALTPDQNDDHSTVTSAMMAADSVPTTR